MTVVNSIVRCFDVSTVVIVSARCIELYRLKWGREEDGQGHKGKGEDRQRAAR